jgi:hypothetical protein
MASLIRRYFKSIDKKTGATIRAVAPKWYGQYTDDAGKTRRVPPVERQDGRATETE